MKPKTTGIFFLKLFKISIVAVIFSIFILSGIPNVSAQKRRPKPAPRKRTPREKKIVTVQPTMEVIESLETPCVPPASDFVSLIEIDKNSNLTLTSKTKDGSKVIAANQPLSSLEQFLLSRNKESVITVSFDPLLSYGSVAKILAEIRRVTNNCANVEASTNKASPYVHYPPEPRDSNMLVKPNPLTLVVEIKSDQRISLNADAKGTLSDTSLLTNTLKEIFNFREKNGIFLEGTNIIAKTVFFKAAPAVKFGDVVKVVDAIKEAGASPVGLQIDDLDFTEPPIKSTIKP